MKQTLFLLLPMLWLCGCSVVTPPPPTSPPTRVATGVPATHIPTVTASPFAPKATDIPAVTETTLPTSTHAPTVENTATITVTAEETAIPTITPGRPKTLPESGATRDIRLLWFGMLFGFSLFLIGIGLWQSGNENE